MLRAISFSRLATRSRRATSLKNRLFSDTPSSSSYSDDAQTPRMRTGPAQTVPGAPASADKTFVSSHYRVAEGQIERFLARSQIAFQLRDGGIKLNQCPFCPPENSRTSFKLIINRENGSYHCAACRSKGSWSVLFLILKISSIFPFFEYCRLFLRN